jgi:DNA-binding response OmpR family regulator
MTDTRIVSGENRRDFLAYLKSLQSMAGSADIEVKSATRTGLVQVRQGRIIAAGCGRLFGNGAFLTLAAMTGGVYTAVQSEQPVAGNVSLTLPLAERLLQNLPGFSRGIDAGDEEEKLQRVIHFFYQFRRKEAGTLLVEILRNNRFYYPAWLWHSRLMTRTDYIRKALNEAKKWGNTDKEIQAEAARIESRMDESASTVKRCFFCWSMVKESETSCTHCQGRFRVAGREVVAAPDSVALKQALASYELEMASCPGNSRIAYCLCLGFYSLGNIERAREYIARAQRISPNEPLFARTAALLVSPQRKVVQAASPVKPAAPKSSTADLVSKSSEKTILVVEDSQTSRKVITMLLERKGYAIVEAKNGAEALARLSEVVPDLVLLDLMLPDMSGYEVLARVRQSKKSAEIPVIMLTGKSNPADRMKGLHHGSNEYLTKPFDPAKLLGVLEKYLDRPVEVKKEAKAEQPAAVARIAPKPPARQAPPAVEPIALRDLEPALASIPESGKSEKTILVVEDSPTSRKVISMVIAKRGYAIHEAATGAVAMRKAQEKTPNLILLDAMLPDMTGYEILHRFKHDERLKNVPIVMLTAKNSPVDRQKGMQGGSVAYITKPFDPEKLLAVIDEYI